MDDSVRRTLLELNRDFYAEQASEFSLTRGRAWPGFERLLNYCGDGDRVLDLGCGNGRLLEFLASRQEHVSYVGVDFSAELLAIARDRTSQIGLADVEFRHGDLSSEEWSQGLTRASFDLVTAVAVLQHVPGWEMRRDLIVQGAALAKDTGAIALANWQFMKSERMRAKVADWSLVGIAQHEVDPGDYLLEWRSGGLTHRYCHMFDRDEVESLARSAGMEIVASYCADGYEGDQNLYTILRRS